MKYLILLLSLIPFSAFTQETLLAKYVEEGLKNNLSLQLKSDDYKMSILKLREAKGLFFPDIDAHARYTVAGGGRTIEFPVGDLLNPVYTSLNQLTFSNNFPMIDNQEFPFLRPREHETKIRLVQPILNSEIYYAHKIREKLAEAEKYNVDSYKRELTAEIKTTYYSYLKFKNIQTILNDTEFLLNENIRVNKSLYANDKVNLDAVYRSETELSKLLQQKAEIQKALSGTAAYFNFLLNRDLLQALETEAIEFNEIYTEPFLDDAIRNALFVREELKILKSHTEAAKKQLAMKKAGFLPEIAAVADYGFQGSSYRFTGDDDFYMASLVLRWDIFGGYIKRSQINQARLALDKIEKQKEISEKTLQLQVINALNELKAASTRIPSAESELTAAREAFRIINRRYNEGQIGLLEFIDARNTLTTAETNLVNSQYEFLISKAEYEKTIGSIE
jgi:outer membrane protein